MPSVKKRKPIYEYTCAGRIVVGYVDENGETRLKKPSDLKAEEQGKAAGKSQPKKSG